MFFDSFSTWVVANNELMKVVKKDVMRLLMKMFHDKTRARCTAKLIVKWSPCQLSSFPASISLSSRNTTSTTVFGKLIIVTRRTVAIIIIPIIIRLMKIMLMTIRRIMIMVIILMITKLTDENIINKNDHPELDLSYAIKWVHKPNN